MVDFSLQRGSRVALLGVFSYCIHGALSGSAPLAEVITDGTVGRPVPLKGADITVRAGLGQLRGGNLFHSFEKFDVDTGGKVTFTGPASVKNVIGRVTGGEPSSIDGTLASTIPDANLYLLNPAGIVFGPNARLDVKGAFHASTAADLRFADGAVFSALDMAGSTLSVTEPQSFGILGARAGTISVNGATLAVGAGKHLSLSGSAVEMVGGTLSAGDQIAGEPVVDPGGRITLLASGNHGFDLAGSEADLGLGGKISLRDGARLAATGNSGGRIELRAEDIRVDGATLSASNFGELAAASGIRIAAGTLALAGTSQLAADAFGAGGAGAVHITAADLRMAGPASISSSSHGGGDAGTIKVAVSGPVTVQGGQLISTAEIGSVGQGGTIHVEAAALQITDAGIFDTSGNGGGDIRLRSESVDILGGSLIQATNLGGADAAGGISISAARLVVDKSQILADTGRPSLRLSDGSASPAIPASGHAGTISIQAIDTLVAQGSAIRSSTFGLGEAGEIDIDVGQLTIDGKGLATAISVNAGSAQSLSPGNAETTGGAGAIVVRADNLTLQASGAISASTFTGGSAGSIDIKVVDLLRMDGLSARDSPTQIVASSLQASPGGPGKIAVAADKINISNGGNREVEIRGSTTGIGDASPIFIAAGDITIDAKQEPLERGRSVPFTGIVSAAIRNDRNKGISVGSAGDIIVNASGSIRLVDGGEISTLTQVPGNGGSIKVIAQNLVIDGVGASNNRKTQIIGSTQDEGAEGNAGNIKIEIADRLRIQDGGRIFATSGPKSKGSAGEIAISADTTDLMNGGTISVGTGGVGNAGKIELNGKALNIDDSSLINSSTNGSGDAGDIRLNLEESISVVGGRISSSASAKGMAGSIDITADAVALLAGAAVSASTEGAGDAGNVIVNATTLTIANGSNIGSETAGQGDAGRVRIVARDVFLGREGGISSITRSESDDAGKGGTIRVDAQRSVILEGGRISTSSEGSGTGGNIVVRAGQGTVTIRGVNESNNSGRLDGLGEITANAKGDGAAGRIDIVARELVARDGLVGTSSIGKEGGKIKVRATERILLHNSTIVADGGVPRTGTSLMTIRASEIILSNGQMTSLTKGRAAAGSGEVTIVGDDLTLVSANSEVRGSTKTLISGLQTNLGSDLQLSPSAFLDVGRLLQPSCANRGAARSTFSRGGRGGLPPAPDRPLPSAGAEPPAAVRATGARPIFLDLCAGSLVPQTKS